MINFGFYIGLPYGLDRNKERRTFFSIDRPIEWLPNKNWDIELHYYTWTNLLSIEIDFGWFGSDHAGPSISIDILGFCFRLAIYDGRHWDSTNGRWYEYGEQS